LQETGHDLGRKAPAFRKQAGATKPPGFSLQLMMAVQELKENEQDEDEQSEFPSVVDRRRRHEEVAKEASAQLERLV